MRASFVFVTVSAVGFGLWLGCGGAASTDLIADVPEGGASSGASGAGTSGASGGTSGRGASGGASGTSGASGDAGSAEGGTPTSLACGTATCTIPTGACCVDRSKPGGAFSCSADGTCADAGANDVAILKCSGAANCAPTQVCCVHVVNNGAASECKTSCAGGEAQLCDPSAPAAATGCKSGVTCSNDKIGDFGLPSTFATCGGKGN